MSKSLIVVESPAKAKTIEKYLGRDFTVKSSIGHIRDLADGDTGVDVENNFRPNYEIPAEKRKVVADLKKAAKSVDTVWLATDEDREGEAIAWHLSEALDLDPGKTKRITYSEITKEAIQYAIQHPRTIDKHLVDAQQARRILDRLVGYEISPILWRKIKPALSAGRVQSVAVRLIVEREREIQNFQSVSSYKVSAFFLTGKMRALRLNCRKNSRPKKKQGYFWKNAKPPPSLLQALQQNPQKNPLLPPLPHRPYSRRLQGNSDTLLPRPCV